MTRCAGHTTLAWIQHYDRDLYEAILRAQAINREARDATAFLEHLQLIYRALHGRLASLTTYGSDLIHFRVGHIFHASNHREDPHPRQEDPYALLQYLHRRKMVYFEHKLIWIMVCFRLTTI